MDKYWPCIGEMAISGRPLARDLLSVLSKSVSGRIRRCSAKPSMCLTRLDLWAGDVVVMVGDVSGSCPLSVATRVIAFHGPWFCNSSLEEGIRVTLSAFIAVLLVPFI